MIRAMLIIGGAALIVGLTLYTLLDAVRTPAHEARTLPKWLWVLVTLLFPVVGPLMWLILGRPKAQPAQVLFIVVGGRYRGCRGVASLTEAKAERERHSREAESNNKQDSAHKDSEPKDPELKDPEDGTPNQGNGQN